MLNAYQYGMGKKFSYNLLIKIRLFAWFLLQLQLFVLLLFPIFFSTKFDTNTGKYFVNYNETLPVLANTNTPTSRAISSSPSTQQIHLFVNLDTCRLYVYINNKLHEYLFVSGGHTASQTPLGTFYLNINKQTFSFIAPDREYYLRCITGSSFHGMPTGLANFSEGDLYLSSYDFAILTEYLYKCKQRPTITIHCTTYPWQTVELGMCNQDVLSIQEMLYTQKLYTGSLNGYFCERTKQAVINFQKTHGLFPTGAVNSATYLKLTCQHTGNSTNLVKPAVLPYTS